MALPDAVLAYRLLNNANIGHEREQQLARATLAKLTYSNMKDQLRKIFDETCLGFSSPKLDQDIKTESDNSADVYYSNNRRQGGNCGRGRMNQRGGYVSGGYVSRGRSQQSKQHGGSVRKRNPVDADGKITKCIICKSIFHWAKDCPDRDKAEIPPDNEKTMYVTLFNEEIEHCSLNLFLVKLLVMQFLTLAALRQYVVKFGLIAIWKR